MVMTAGLVSGQFLLYGGIKDGKSQLMLRALPSSYVEDAERDFFPAALGAPPGVEIHAD